MNRKITILISGIFLLWTTFNLVAFLGQMTSVEKLEAQETSLKAVEEYIHTKIAPCYPESLRSTLSQYDSQLASLYIREEIEDIHCILVTKPVYLDGFLLYEVTEKIVLTAQLSDYHSSINYEVGHRLNPILPRPRQVAYLIAYQENGGRHYYPVIAHRVKGLAHLPENFVLQELRKIAMERQGKGNQQ